MRAKNLALEQNFSGIVDEVSIYGGKQDILVKLKNNTSHLLDLYRVKEEDGIEVGDSLYKAKDKLTLYQYRWNNAKEKFELKKVYRFSTFFD